MLPTHPQHHKLLILTDSDSLKSSIALLTQLLEIAKIGVEKAIETDEETATAWIKQQLESLGVKLI
jgi:type I restriction enzyme M protein